MPLNPVKGNMYDFCTHTFNFIKGVCPHKCEYCYMRQFKQNPVRLDTKEFKTDLGTDNFIFTGSSCDMFAESIEKDWIMKGLDYLSKFDNKYLFQSKNPQRMIEFADCFPARTVLGTTIETNRIYPAMGLAPEPASRAHAMSILSRSFTTMVTVEPIMDFDSTMLALYIVSCNPAWVNIGADSKKNNLPEPNEKKIRGLIDSLEISDLEVKLKPNLKRLGGGGII